jgi:hypothetical protein
VTAPAGDLAALLRAVHEARGDEEVPLPSPEPHDGQSVAQWRAEVSHARAMADAGALRHRVLVRQLRVRGHRDLDRVPGERPDRRQELGDRGAEQLFRGAVDEHAVAQRTGIRHRRSCRTFRAAASPRGPARAFPTPRRPCA